MFLWASLSDTNKWMDGEYNAYTQTYEQKLNYGNTKT